MGHCEPPPVRMPESAASCERLSASCCAEGVPVFDGMDPRYRHILWAIIAINGAMFLTEMIAGRSQALQADALDFLADTATYGLSLAVIGFSLKARARAALLKGMSLSVIAAWVLGSTIYHTFVLGVPRAEIVGG
jgi:Co/Zn/Cd efflux system component